MTDDKQQTPVVVDLTNTDWDALRQQKLSLLEILDDVAPPIVKARYALIPNHPVVGIIHFLDYIQDEAAKVIGEKAVFGRSKDDPDLRESWCMTYEVVDGYVKNEQAKPVSQVYEYIKQKLPKYGVDLGEYDYFSIGTEVTYGDDKHSLWPCMDRIAVFAVEGGSEGYYIHVDAITADGAHNIFLGKTLQEGREGRDHALKLANALTHILET